MRPPEEGDEGEGGEGLAEAHRVRRWQGPALARSAALGGGSLPVFPAGAEQSAASPWVASNAHPDQGSSSDGGVGGRGEPRM